MPVAFYVFFPEISFKQLHVFFVDQMWQPRTENLKCRVKSQRDGPTRSQTGRELETLIRGNETTICEEQTPK